MSVPDIFERMVDGRGRVFEKGKKPFKGSGAVVHRICRSGNYVQVDLLRQRRPFIEPSAVVVHIDDVRKLEKGAKHA